MFLTGGLTDAYLSVKTGPTVGTDTFHGHRNGKARGRASVRGCFCTAWLRETHVRRERGEKPVEYVSVSASVRAISSSISSIVMAVKRGGSV